MIEPMKNFATLEEDIINCHKCKRLINHCKSVSTEKVKRYQNDIYWARPVPGFGDQNAELIIIGLAPGMHGANRTGRMFTGDSSGDWLFKAMYETGFANQSNSDHSNDGLHLVNAFICSTAHCAPPQNKLKSEEINNCSSFLTAYLDLLNRKKVIICLGGVAHKNYCKIFKIKNFPFAHLNIFDHANVQLIASYHPSKYNTQTKRLKWDAWLEVFHLARKIID